METKKKKEEMRDVGYRLPVQLCTELDKSAKKNRRSINQELSFILETYFGQENIIWENHIYEEILEYAQYENATFSWAVNYLLQSIIDQWRAENISFRNKSKTPLRVPENEKKTG